MANEMCNFIVKWAGNEFKINVTASGTVLCLKKEIENQTSVKINRQKLLNLKHKGTYFRFSCSFLSPLFKWRFKFACIPYSVYYDSGKAAEDNIKLSNLGLKPGFKIMMMGSLEEDITVATTAPENIDEVVNDLDLTEEEIALENREEYIAKVKKLIRARLYNSLIDLPVDFKACRKL